MILQLAANHDVLVTVEENAIAGGAGSGVNEFLMKQKVLKPVLNIGLPDRFVEQGTQAELHAMLEIDGPGIEKQIRAYID